MNTATTGTITVANWKERITTAKEAIRAIEPGMNIFLSTGISGPRTLVKELIESKAGNLRDLELIQLVSLDDQLLSKGIDNRKYRLKTFCSGWLANEAITAGRIDLIPARFDQIPRLVASGRISIDAAFVQITPPDASGYCSLGMSVDAARAAIEQAKFVVGEINDELPRAYGDTFVSICEFDMLVRSTEPSYVFPRYERVEVFDKIAAIVSSVIEDGSCLSFSLGPLFESLGSSLTNKRHLGIHTHFFTDAVMDLMNQGVVSNRNKETYRGKSLTSYAVGTPSLMQWLDRNPLVEFQSTDISVNPIEIGRNSKFVAVLRASKVDLTGCLALPTGIFNVAGDPKHVTNHVFGAEISKGGYTVFALPSRNRENLPNIRLSIEKHPAKFTMRESVDMIVTEYGIAHLRGKTLRERAQSIIEVANPEDRQQLMEQAKAAHILYSDQIFIPESAYLYPSKLSARRTFRDMPEVLFRAIKPSDEEEMRRLFYRFSDESVYYRYFTPIDSMPHSKMQEYVNIDYHDTMSVVGVIDSEGKRKIVAEARYVGGKKEEFPEIAFVVDEAYQGRGIASYLFRMLVRLAKDAGIRGFSASVLSSNKPMMKLFESSGYRVHAKLEYGIYELSIPFQKEK